jgi:hypothetical protein
VDNEKREDSKLARNGYSCLINDVDEWNSWSRYFCQNISYSIDCGPRILANLIQEKRSSLQLSSIIA